MRGAITPIGPAILLLLAGFGGSAGVLAATTALELEVETPVFAGSELEVEVRQAGALAGRPLAIQLVVDGVSVGRFETTGETTLLRARPEGLSAGRHAIAVKSGSLRAEQSIRVWPGWLPGVAIGGLLLIGVGLIAALRRRRALPAAPPRG